MRRWSFLAVWVRSSIAALVALLVAFAAFMVAFTHLGASLEDATSIEVIRGVLAFILLGAFIAGLASALVMRGTRRRFASEIARFSDALQRAAAGDTRALSQRYEVDIVNTLAEQVDRVGTRVELALESERRLSREVSHQLRTPLTALGLRLEEISRLEDLGAIRGEAAVAQAQVERLGGVIDQLMALGRGEGPTTADVWLGPIVNAQVEEWSPAFAAHGRALESSGHSSRRARVNPAAAEQVLATLLDNSLVHGAGTTRIDVREEGSWVTYDVVDSGGRIKVDESVDIFARGASADPSGGGLGLGLARRLVEADGGRLELVRRDPVTFRVFVRIASDEQSRGGGPVAGDGADSSRVEFLGLDDSQWANQG